MHGFQVLLSVFQRVAPYTPAPEPQRPLPAGSPETPLGGSGDARTATYPPRQHWRCAVDAAAALDQPPPLRPPPAAAVLERLAGGPGFPSSTGSLPPLSPPLPPPLGAPASAGDAPPGPTAHPQHRRTRALAADAAAATHVTATLERPPPLQPPAFFNVSVTPGKGLHSSTFQLNVSAFRGLTKYNEVNLLENSIDFNRV
jgi:hypothetical protein